VAGEVRVKCARSDFVPVLVDKEHAKVVGELGSVVERYEDVEETGEQSLPSDLDRILSLLRLFCCDFETGVEGAGDVFEEDITPPLDLVSVHIGLYFSAPPDGNATADRRR
jgi:hypothetical protein